ncbi:MAG: RdgB/HAM1 family non-canonical purine NTP pyrophosphatase [Lachnospiraceae bacterium]|nr:RdgB/HAM1 family non-canonical purine NTP pyrophosphatase [Lachnospiraceae bacterium]
MTKILFATGNKGKVVEVKEILKDLEAEVITMKEAGYDIEVDENGTTYEENAVLKAKAVMEASGCLTLADDSGLEVDYLNKEPGIHSARYMGHDTSYDVKNQSIIDKLEGVPEDKRTARFVCAIAAAFPDGRIETVRATMEGIIGHEIAGGNGFGFDPIFFLPERGMTSAEISPEEKNEISHRGKALRLMRDRLIELGVFN